MRILVIGASGQTGSLVVEEALQRGHTVTALIRNENSMKEREGLSTVKGTALEISDIDRAFTATAPSVPEAVIVTLASTRKSGSPWAEVTAPPRLMADSIANLIIVMRAHSVSKIAIMSSLGTGSSFPNLTFLMRSLINHSNLHFSYVDHNLVDVEIRSSQNKDIDYILVRPTRLTGGGKAPLKFYGGDGVGIGALQGVSRASVAGFLVDAVEQTKWLRSTPVIAN